MQPHRRVPFRAASSKGLGPSATQLSPPFLRLRVRAGFLFAANPDNVAADSVYPRREPRPPYGRPQHRPPPGKSFLGQVRRIGIASAQSPEKRIHPLVMQPDQFRRRLHVPAPCPLAQPLRVFSHNRCHHQISRNSTPPWTKIFSGWVTCVGPGFASRASDHPFRPF